MVIGLCYAVYKAHVRNRDNERVSPIPHETKKQSQHNECEISCKNIATHVNNLPEKIDSEHFEELKRVWEKLYKLNRRNKKNPR